MTFTTLQVQVQNNGRSIWHAFQDTTVVTKGYFGTRSPSPSKKTLVNNVVKGLVAKGFELPEGAKDPRNWFSCHGAYCWESPFQVNGTRLAR